MKYFIIIFFLLSKLTILAQNNLPSNGQNNPIKLEKDSTEKDIVALDNFYSDDSIYENKTKYFANPYASNKLYTSNRFKIGIYADDTWKFKKSNTNKPWEFLLRNKSDDSYMFFYTESSSNTKLVDFNKSVYSNAESFMTDIELVKSEYRNVNNLKILSVQIRGKIKGKKMEMINYFYIDNLVFLQLCLMSKQSYFKSSQKDYEKLLNGLVLIK